MKDDVIMCRCEDITFGEIKEWIKNGYTDYEDLKRLSRAGMGACQGRTCRENILKLIAAAEGTTIEEKQTGQTRPPLHPVKLEDLAKGIIVD